MSAPTITDAAVRAYLARPLPPRVDGYPEDCAGCQHFHGVGLMSTHEPGVCAVDGLPRVSRDDCTLPGSFVEDTRTLGELFPAYDLAYWRAVLVGKSWVGEPFKEAVAGERGRVDIGGVLIPTSKGERLMDHPDTEDAA